MTIKINEISSEQRKVNGHLFNISSIHEHNDNPKINLFTDEMEDADKHYFLVSTNSLDWTEKKLSVSTDDLEKQLCNEVETFIERGKIIAKKKSEKKTWDKVRSMVSIPEESTLLQTGYDSYDQ